MGRGGAGNTLRYGKIELVSDSSSMPELEKTLGNILKKYSYPEMEKHIDLGDIGRQLSGGELDKKFEEEFSKRDVSSGLMVEEVPAEKVVVEEDDEKEGDDEEDDDVIEEVVDGEVEGDRLPPWIKSKVKK